MKMAYVLFIINIKLEYSTKLKTEDLSSMLSLFDKNLTNLNIINF